MRALPRLVALPAAFAVLSLLPAAAVAPAAAATGDIGSAGQSYGSLTRPPTGSKPESKLWFNGGWWAGMFNAGASEHRIYKLDPATARWRDTGVPIDARASSRADALWDAATGKLYIASHVYTTSGRRAGKGNSGRALPLQLQRGHRHLRARPGIPGRDQRRQERDARDRQGLDRHALGYLDAGQARLRQPLRRRQRRPGARRTSFPVRHRAQPATTSPRSSSSAATRSA